MATGSNYPTSNDSFADKATSDYFTVADCNVRSSAIEKLETGPLRLADGSVSAPAFSFMADPDTGIYRVTGNSIDFATAGARVLQLGTVTAGVNYVTIIPGATGSGPSIDVEGTDSNIPLAIDTKGSGSLQLRASANLVAQMVSGGGANNFRFTSAAASGSPVMQVEGTDTNISFINDTKGTGVQFFRIGGTDSIVITRLLGGGGFKFFGEASGNWGSAGANNAHLYLKDNGSGKTQLIVEFNTGGAVVVATEP